LDKKDSDRGDGAQFETDKSLDIEHFVTLIKTTAFGNVFIAVCIIALFFGKALFFWR
jgi:hypothetical protein